MNRYTVQLNYNASIVVEVEANDEGEALSKARDLAEDADMEQFNLGEEQNTQILNVSNGR